MKKLITIVCLTASTSALADYPIYPVEELQKMAVELINETEAVSRIQKSLPNAQNWGEAQALGDIASQFEDDLHGVEDMGRIYNQMVDSRDMKYIEYEIFIKKTGYRNKCEHRMIFLDRAISMANRNDLIAVGNRIKAKVIKSCEYIKNWK